MILNTLIDRYVKLPCGHEICSFPIHSTIVLFLYFPCTGEQRETLEIIKLGSGAIYKHQVSKPGFKFSSHRVTVAA